jgi:hypothetical protein
LRVPLAARHKWRAPLYPDFTQELPRKRTWHREAAVGCGPPNEPCATGIPGGDRRSSASPAEESGARARLRSEAASPAAIGDFPSATLVLSWSRRTATSLRADRQGLTHPFETNTTSKPSLVHRLARTRPSPSTRSLFGILGRLNQMRYKHWHNCQQKDEMRKQLRDDKRARNGVSRNDVPKSQCRHCDHTVVKDRERRSDRCSCGRIEQSSDAQIQELIGSHNFVYVDEGKDETPSRCLRSPQTIPSRQ